MRKSAKPEPTYEFKVQQPVLCGKRKRPGVIAGYAGKGEYWVQLEGREGEGPVLAAPGDLLSAELPDTIARIG